jgi:hypothetical protein
MIEAAFARRFRWLRVTPFGSPDDPDVKNTAAGASPSSKTSLWPTSLAVNSCSESLIGSAASSGLRRRRTFIDESTTLASVAEIA